MGCSRTEYQHNFPLRTGDGRVQEALGVPVRITKPLITARIFPALMMMGMMILIVSLITPIIMATNSYGCWNHCITTKLNPVAAGSQLLGCLLTIDTVNAWLAPFKFVGVAPVVPASAWP